VDQELEDILCNQNEEDQFKQYINTFIQRQPRYAVKQKGKGTWRTKNKPLSDRPIKAHLNGQYYVGVLGKWYPTFTILDIDNRDQEFAEELREALKLDTNSSMLNLSESDKSYHLLFRPSYNGKPPTIRLLNEVLKPFAREHNIEVYPQANKPIRLPFGKGQKPLDFEYISLDNWKKLLYWFNKLDYFDLKGMPYHQMHLDLDVEPDNTIGLTEYQEGKFLWEHGLIEPSSRHQGQFKILCYLHRGNTTLEMATEMTYRWIKAKHNGLSKEANAGKWRTIKEEIKRQARSVYRAREFYNYYPDETHNSHKGFITKADIQDIVMLSNASLPKAKFYFNLIKYAYPRRHRTFLQVHSDNLKEWSHKGYIRHLRGLERLGIVQRYDSYKVDKFAKSIKLNWNFKDTGQAILIDNRAPEEFADTVKASYEPEEFRELFLKAGSERTYAIKAVKRIFESVTKH
jgi:hypothetical protein